jgi:hypothetical protein
LLPLSGVDTSGPFAKNVEVKSVPRLSIDEVEVAAQLGGFNF